METIEKKLNKNVLMETAINKDKAGELLDSYIKLNNKQQHPHQPKYASLNQSINEHTYSSNLKLDEMITLEVIKSSKLTGTTKKMLHVPSMKIFIVKVRILSININININY